jgi:hypothetical protein
MPDIRTVVNHINHNTTDNRAENLEWVIPLENTVHGNGIAFDARNKSTGVVEYFPSIREAARHGIHGRVYSERLIRKCLKHGRLLGSIIRLTKAPVGISG